MKKLTALFILSLVAIPILSFEPIPFTISTKKWSHILDDHFISITINPTDLLQGKVYGLGMNSTMAILKGLAPAYVRIGSADTSKYTFKKSRHPTDMIKPEDEYTVTETHWMVFNELLQSAGLNVIVCLNAAHRIEGTKKWDTRNSLELISFSDSQGYNLTWQLGYEIQSGEELSGIQFGKDLNRLRTILNAFPRYQHAKLIGPDIRVIHKKEDVEFWNDVLIEAGPTLDAVTWHPRWPQPSKMKVSEDSDLGYEFPIDYLEWDRVQFNKILQRSIFKNTVWIGETKRESTGTFAEGLIWARRLLLAAKQGIEVVMKQPNLMDITHPKPEYWIALLHKRLLGKAVLETRSVANSSDLMIISHCTNPYYWTDKPERLQDGPITVYGVNLGGTEQKIQIKGTWTGRTQLVFHYVLTSGSDPDSVFSQMTYLNGEPLMMTDEGTLPDIIPKIKKLERGVTMKLPPYSIGFWVVPEAKVKICQVHTQNLPAINIQTLTPSMSHKSHANDLKNIENINQFIVDKLKNPESESEEIPEVKIESGSEESTEKEINLLSRENNLPRVPRKIRQVENSDGTEKWRKIIEETQNIFTQPEKMRNLNVQMKRLKGMPAMEQRIYSIAEGISDAMKTTNQEHEFDKFLQYSGLNKNFGNLLVADRKFNAPRMPNINVPSRFPGETANRYRRSVDEKFKSSVENGNEDVKSSREKHENETEKEFDGKIKNVEEEMEGEEDKIRKEDLIIPSQIDSKELENKSEDVTRPKAEQAKREIGDAKKNQGEIKTNQKNKLKEELDKTHERIVKKEIDLISKAEETVESIFESQMKQHEIFDEIIVDELNNLKKERIEELEEIQRNHKKEGNDIEKGKAQHSPIPLTEPLLKTVEYIEKNFQMEPESVSKIKRSLEERMSEILENYDRRKNAQEAKRIMKEETSRKSANEDEETERKKERKNGLSNPRNSEVNKERSKERIHFRKTTSNPKSQQTNGKYSRKYYSSQEGKKETTDEEKQTAESRNRKKSEGTPLKIKKLEAAKKIEEMENDSFELFNAKKFEIPPKKSDRKQFVVQGKENEKLVKMNSDEGSKTEKSSIKNDDEREEVKHESDRQKERLKEEKKSGEAEENMEDATSENLPLKHDKRRRANMLKQITNMVNNMNMLDKDRARSKRMNFDEDDLSEEFEPERKTSKLKRRPRKTEEVKLLKDDVKAVPAEIGQENPAVKAPAPKEEKISKLSEKPEVVESTQTTEPATATTVKPGRRRKNRRRPNRKMKTADGEETSQIKRHLTEIERPYLDVEKKKFIKPKLRKINPKFFKIGNDLNEERQPAIAKVEEEPLLEPAIVPMLETITPTVLEAPIVDSEPKGIPMPNPAENRELIKDLEQLIEENHFLDRKSKTMREESETSGGNFLGGKQSEKGIRGETPKPTTDSALPELPAIEMKEPEIENLDQFLDRRGDDVMQERVMELAKDDVKPTNGEVKFTDPNAEVKSTDQNAEVKSTDPNAEVKSTNPNAEVKSTEQIGQSIDPKIEARPAEPEVAAKTASPMTRPSKDTNHPSEEMSSERFSSIEDVEEEEEGRETKSDFTSGESINEEDLKTPTESGRSQRKRRSTFLVGRRKVEEDEDESEEEESNYSSEERIKKFKQMIYRKSPSAPKKAIKNEIRSTVGNLGADDFLRMAGSTVRVMFDNVIPEAYGQTKTKIQNMGLSEYIKEFGKLVQQMRNLDQIFFNIGEAAVKGYIRGNRSDKGPYIQVISRKKRQVSEMEDDGAEEPSVNDEDSAMAAEVTTSIPSQYLNDKIEMTTESSPPRIKPFPSRDQVTAEGRLAGSSSETTAAEETIASDQRRSDRKSGLPREIGWKMDQDAAATGTTVETWMEKEGKATTAASVDESETDSQLAEGSTTIRNDEPEEEPKAIKLEKELQENDFRLMATERAMKNWLDSYIKEDLRDNIAPWIKTTKDFIQQALTTLQRQRQLTEILAADGFNLIKKQSAKYLEKRETGADEPELPVYHLIAPNNKKRETQKQSDETLMRQLKGMQPGVYVVPTEEMTNVRSEQITTEPKRKSGLPNVVTLNIYYDKKNPDGTEKPETADETSESRISQDAVTYYQNKAWNSIASHYDQNNQFVSRFDSPEMTVSPQLATPFQVGQVYATDPRMAELPHSRLYPPASYHYSASHKFLPATIHGAPPTTYGPVLYLQPEATYPTQGPGTRGQWRDFKVTGSGPISAVPASNFDSGWNLQFGPPPGGSRKSSRSKLFPYKANLKMIGTDMKRSIDEYNVNPNWSESALPFWKFFTPPASGKNGNKDASDEDGSPEKVEKGRAEGISSGEIFQANRKRAEEDALKQIKINAIKSEMKSSEKNDGTAERRKREIGSDFVDGSNRKLSKRSHAYGVEFEDHDILPQWFGTYRDVDNSIDEFVPHIRRSHIVSTPWSDEDEELLATILDAEDQLTLMDADDDAYYGGYSRSARHPRSIDSRDGAMLETNMIYKRYPDDGETAKSKHSTETGMKSVRSEDSSLEMPLPSFQVTTGDVKTGGTQRQLENNSDGMGEGVKPGANVENREIDRQRFFISLSSPTPETVPQQSESPIRFVKFQTGFDRNGTESLPENLRNDAFYSFFKYAYDSFVRVMKSMTRLF